ncbi:DUF4249 domain-containing protein [Mariniphaga sediminis]|uniref:DUF4249 domain-containing protein n=1 Tax=Mariniphaga sediminis TaxID=1628158 RepID=A0A399D079_9BACT|nr:DUF4249 family protein [Mariniphaga sediminis]RIH64866.1 DUF4249 domain-containing protein [Mariniphaga sediminis]
MQTKYIFFLAFVFILMNACEDVIDIELSDEDVGLYAVEAKITTEDNPYVFLYKTQPVSSAEPYIGVSGAVVTISDNSQPPQTIQLAEDPENTGLYIPEEGITFHGEYNKEYMVSISVGETTLTASDMLAKVEPIDSIQVHSSLRGDHLFLGIFTYGNETPGIGNYYKWDIYINNELLSGSEYLAVVSDEMVDGNYVNGFEIFTDFHDPEEPSERLLNLGDTIQVKQTSISEFAWHFYSQMFEQGQTGGLFSVPPANIKGNFLSDDGRQVLGLFTAHDVSASNVVVIDEAIEEQLKE